MLLLNGGLAEFIVLNPSGLVMLLRHFLAVLFLL